jgi:hypothetical protein
MTGLPADLLGELRRRAADPSSARDRNDFYVIQGCFLIPAEGPPAPPAPRASPDQLATSARLLGFPLPAALQQLYGQVANGGFGPGHGLLGLAGGATDIFGQTAIETYQVLRTPWAGETPPWPEGLLPICDWGDAGDRDGMSCVNCFDPELPIIRHENEWLLDAKHYPERFTPEGRTLHDWLRAWIDGEELFLVRPPAEPRS